MTSRVARVPTPVHCPTCGFRGTYSTAGYAATALRKHSCERIIRLAAQAEARTQRQASREYPAVDCTHTTIHHEHGDRLAYKRDGCRCFPCTEANRLYNLDNRRNLAYGRSRLVDAEPVRDHVRNLAVQGMGTRRVADLAGVSTTFMQSLMNGNNRQAVRKRVDAERAARILALQPQLASGACVDGVGTSRRIQALIARGWPQAQLAKRIGMTPTNFTPVVHGRRGRVLFSTHQAVCALYNELWDVLPSSSTPRERGAVTWAMRIAATNGWQPPLAWDDETIDDPNAAPANAPDGTSMDAWVAEVKWMLDQGANFATLTNSLGMKRATVEKRLRRAAPDVWRQLINAELRRGSQDWRAA